ncbi:MAG: dihydrofolate reductase [Maricaulaceae bacterium]
MPDSLELVLIAARGRNGVIGADGGLPWRLPSDLKRFKALTLGKPVLMGRKTWDSLPRKPLPGRPNLVLTRQTGLVLDGAETFTAFDAMLKRARDLAAGTGAGEICVIGGEALYRLAMPLAARCYLTDVEADTPGDAVFPALDPAVWVEIARERPEPDPRDDAPYQTVVWERRGAR